MPGPSTELAATTRPELAEKRARVLDILDRQDLDAVVLRRPGNVAWFSGGGRTHIVATPDVGVADVVVTRDETEVVTAVNEAARLEAEELGALDARFTVLPWDADRVSALPAGARVGSDVPLRGTRDIADAIEAARRRLTDEELDRYRLLGRDAAQALTAACMSLQPQSDELDAAAAIASLLYECGADPIVVLVAGERRVAQHRHPLPLGGERLEGLAMLVACARRAGLIVSLTRLVSFGSLPAHLSEVHAGLSRVDVAFNAATTPGRSVGSAFAAGAAAYAEQGFAADEWRLHHQGGPTGYEPRDYLANAQSAAIIEERQAFAWNPTVPSLKAEDTIVSGGEVITVDEAWPTADVDGWRRPLVLER